MPLTPEDTILPSPNYPTGYYFRPWRANLQSMTQDTGSTMINEKDKFQINLDVQQFLPNEITVKMNNKEIIIEGKHEERQDEHGFISRQFIRRYILPDDCKEDEVKSTLSADGVLTIIANKNFTISQEQLKHVPILRLDPKKKMREVEERSECKMTSEKMEKYESDYESKAKCSLEKSMESKIESTSSKGGSRIEKDLDKMEKDLDKIACEFKNMTEARRGNDLESKIDKIMTECNKMETFLTDKISTNLEKSDILQQSIGGIRSDILDSKGKISSDLLMSSAKGMCSEMMASSAAASVESKTEEFSSITEISKSKESFMSCDIKQSTEKSSDYLSEIIASELKMASENL